MTETVLLAVAGIAAGLSASIAGLASLFSYPALLSVGLPPVMANVTNTVALVGSGVGSALGSRPEFTGQGRRIRRLGALALVGGATGAALLLVTPAETCEVIVPWLIGTASVVTLVQPRPELLRTRHRGGDSPALTLGIFLAAVYGGYFGAAAGVMILALLLAASSATLAQSNALKNVVLAIANGIAAVAFIVLAPVAWSAAIPLGLGCLVGGRVGPIVVRHAPARPLRILIGLAGLGLAAKLALDAYG